MARDWNKAARRAKGNSSRRAAYDIQAELREMDRLHVPIDPLSKAALREQAAAAMAGFTGQVRRLPTMIDLRCACGHRKRIAIPDGTQPRFRCSRCGSRV